MLAPQFATDRLCLPGATVQRRDAFDDLLTVEGHFTYSANGMNVPGTGCPLPDGWSSGCAGFLLDSFFLRLYSQSLLSRRGWGVCVRG